LSSKLLLYISRSLFSCVAIAIVDQNRHFVGVLETISRVFRPLSIGFGRYGTAFLLYVVVSLLAWGSRSRRLL
jgi:chemotaxis receptor (MCP) glutamine deamidase CheD